MLEEELRNLKLAELDRSRTPAPRPGPPRAQPVEPAAEYRAADSSNSIWVTVDPGGKVLRIDVSGSWLSRLPAGEFGNAVLMTYVNAVQTAALAESRAREREHVAPPASDGWAFGDAETDFGTWLANIQARQDGLDQRLREAKENLRSVTSDVTEMRGPYGFVTLRMRSDALIGLTTNSDAVSRANVGQVRQDLWEVFDDAGLTSRGGPAAAPSRPRRPRAEELDPEEDLWKGLGQ